MSPRGRKLLGVGLAALFGALSVSAAPREALAQDAVEAAALLRFQRARELFTAERWEPALAEFRAALGLVSSPNTRLYIARCLHNLHRNAEALLEYQRAGAEAADRAAREPRYQNTRDTAREEAAVLEPLLGRLVLHLGNPPQGLEVRLGDRVVPPVLFGVPAPVDVGELEVRASAPGYLAFQRRVTVTSGATTELQVTLSPDPAAQREELSRARSGQPPRMVEVQTGGALRWVGVAVGGAGLVGGAVLLGVFGSQASARFNELRTACPAGCPDMESRIAEGERAQTIANASLGVGIGLVAVGAVLVAVGGPRTERRPAPAERAAVRVAPWVELGGATRAAGLAGSF